MRVFQGLLVCAAFGYGLAVAQAAKPETLVLSHVRLIDGTGAAPVEDTTIVIEHGRIASIGSGSSTGSKVMIPRGAQVIDETGKTVIPGLINAHGHLGLVSGTENTATAYTRENVASELKQYEGYGVTTLLSLGGNRDLVFDLRREQREGKLDGADIFTAGRGIGAPGGAPGFALASDQIYRPATVEEARAAVRAMAAQHVDIVKMWVDDQHGTKPTIPPAISQAIIEEAHRLHVRVAAHIYSLANAKLLVNDGVDVLAHSVRDELVDQELIDAMKRRGTWYIPTFTVDDSFFIYARHPAWMDTAFFKTAAGPEVDAMLTSPAYVAKVKGDPGMGVHEKDFAIAQQNLKRLFDAGVHIGFGTDSGAMAWRIPGFAEHRELELMVMAGLTPMQAIVCATRNNAELLHVEDRGTLAVGKRADLVVLDGNPVDGIANVHRLVIILHDGQIIQPEATTGR